MAISTATEPDSEKNTRSRSPGTSAASRRASVSACSCTSPPNITCGMTRELTLDRLPDVRMIVAVAGGPPRRDAVDQLASVGEHDAAAMGARHRQRRRAPSSSAHRAARRGRARPHTTFPELPFFATFAPFNAKLDRHDGLSSRMHSLDEFATAKLGELERGSLRRALVDTTRSPGIWVLRNGRRLLSFCCNDYLNLTHHPAVKEAAIAALRTYGVGAGASRLVTGNHPLFAELEARLARLKETEAACVFGSGYLANLGIIPALIGPGDLVLIDELAHACLWAGARLSRAAVVPFRHSDVRHAAGPAYRVAAASPARADRDRRRLFHGRRSRPLARPRGAGAASRRLAHVRRCPRRRRRRRRARLDFRARRSRPTSRCRWARCPRRSAAMAAISAPPPPVIDLMRNRARTFVYSTGLPPAMRRGRHRRARPDRTRARLCRAAAGKGQGLHPLRRAAGAGRARSCRRCWARPRRRWRPRGCWRIEGFLVIAIRPPTVPAGTARLRLTFTAAASRREIERLAELVRTHVLAHAPASAADA